MKKLSLLSILFLQFIFLQAQDRTDLFIDSVMHAQHIPGAAVAVIQDGQVLKKSVYGKANLEWNQDLTYNSAFQMASTTKLFTGVLLGILHEKKVISVDDCLEKYMDSLPNSWETITLRQLASHQSGIKMVELEKFPNLQTAIKAAMKEKLEYEPGTKEYYVSTDYAFLNQVLLKISGKSFPELMKEMLLDPLKLQNTGFDLLKDEGLFRTADLIENRVGVYGWAESRPFISDMRFPDWFYPAGGIYSSIDDLSRFMQALDREELISTATQELIFGPNPLKNGNPSYFGLGWITETYQGHRLTGHSGGPALADVIRFPDLKISIIVLTNRRGGFYPFLSRGVAQYYIDGLVMPEIPQ
ncbi:serine hydrolase domain-containing protein [Algoriphagus hitonicola]|uniref:CubicO group peptidase, beta-lactamase class C family n=1 Tax=Algoriphagus hitonicola TaxID=435880 RepID=A0A1I2QDA4_9BACT|nr:serine hydrolase domain-containing protein [Algoriphagus hitonicola]SFG23591.1 CubicO group peptidase, beta-lactamase class C family [Algoriphagus hitonicola]